MVDFENGFRKAPPAVQKRLLRKTVKQLALSRDKLSIWFYTSDADDVPGRKLKLVRDENDSDGVYLVSGGKTALPKLAVGSSDIGGYGEPGESISELLYPSDIIQIPSLEKPDFSKEIVEKYQKGFSLKEISEIFGCSKCKVLKELRKKGVNTRPKRALPTHEAVVTGGRGGRKPYYGFCYLDGKLGKHPAEFPVLRIIHQRWVNKVSVHHITCELNKRKIKSRENREWSWAAVKGIVSRFESGALTVDGRSFKFNSYKVERI